MRYFGRRPDGGPIQGGLWWMWDIGSSQGHWITAEGIRTETSTFTVNRWLEDYVDYYIELKCIPAEFRSDFEMDEGL